MADQTFWSNAATEPKRKYRFTFSVGELEIFTITKVTRPSFNISETPHTFFNHTFYYPGKIEWQTINFTLVDPISPDSTAILMKMLMASGYQFPDKQFGGTAKNYGSVSKVSSIGATGACSIVAYDQLGARKEVWRLKNAWMKNVGMNEFEYTSDDMLMMDVELRYDWATIEGGPGGFGDRASTSLKTPFGTPVSDSMLGAGGEN